MNFKEAKTKLKKLAEGKYHTLKYQIAEFGDGELHQECSVYIHGYNWHSEETWEAALKSLKNEINPPSAKSIEIESIEEIK